MAPLRCVAAAACCDNTSVACARSRILLPFLLTSCAAALVAAGGGASGACAAAGGSETPACRGDSNADQVALLQSGLHVGRRQGRMGREQSSCAALTFTGDCLTVSVGIGTPAQYFDAIADTGSDDLVIPGCHCESCQESEPCFDKSKSSTASVADWGLKLSYGSGDIETRAATDIVSINTVTAVLDDGVMLIEDYQLDSFGPFDGLIGLGVPKNHPLVPQFLPTAGVQRFSLCYQKAGGALEMDVPELSTAMEQIGTLHWGLGLWGISAGSSEVPVVACGTDAMTSASQQTPCGAIPDSGTTYLMGPMSQILVMYASLCDAWERCAAMEGKTDAEKAANFKFMVSACNEWLEDDEGLEEIPSLFWRFGSSNETAQTIELTPWSYIASLEVDVRGQDKHATHKVCYPMIGEYEYPTSTSGSIWIAGLPLFYQYKVYFDQSFPMKIGFSQEPCGGCQDGAAKTALLTEQAVPLGGGDGKNITGSPSRRTLAGGIRHATRRKIMTLSKTPRMPDFNISEPL